jgi:hypothetical protein
MNYEQSNAASESAPANAQHESNTPSTERKDLNEHSGAQPATVLVRGETVRGSGEAPKNGSASGGATKDSDKPISQPKLAMKNRLPALEDDSQIGMKKEQIVTRDDKADLAFDGTLIASAAPTAAPKGSWREYRVYETSNGKHVFSKITRSVYLDVHDTHEAEIFDPAPSSVPSQLLRSARDLTRSKPLSWTDAASDYFGYDPLAKILYRKLSGDFEEHIT